MAGAWIWMVSRKNRLLEAAQAALREAREELELRVKERAAELADTNAVLQLVQAEVAVRQRTEEERDRFFSLSVDMLCICGSDGFHRRVSPAFTRILGWTESELLARPFVEFVHLDDRPALRERIKQVISGQSVFDFEFRCLGKDGSYRWTAWTASPMDPDGLFYGCGRDISERKKTEKQLQLSLKEQAASLSLLNATLESTTDGILAVNLAHKVVCHNQKFVTLWGLPAAIMATKNGTEVAAYIARLVCDTEFLLERVRRLREDHELEAFDVVPLKDGRGFRTFPSPPARRRPMRGRRHLVSRHHRTPAGPSASWRRLRARRAWPRWRPTCCIMSATSLTASTSR